MAIGLPEGEKTTFTIDGEAQRVSIVGCGLIDVVTWDF